MPVTLARRRTSLCDPASLPRCLVASLPRCLVASLPRCLVASLPRCLVASLPRCLVACCLVASLPRCLVASLPRCLVASLPRCLVASLPRCLVASLPRCLVASSAERRACLAVPGTARFRALRIRYHARPYHKRVESRVLRALWQHRHQRARSSRHERATGAQEKGQRTKERQRKAGLSRPSDGGQAKGSMILQRSAQRGSQGAPGSGDHDARQRAIVRLGRNGRHALLFEGNAHDRDVRADAREQPADSCRRRSRGGGQRRRTPPAAPPPRPVRRASRPRIPVARGRRREGSARASIGTLRAHGQAVRVRPGRTPYEGTRGRMPPPPSPPAHLPLSHLPPPSPLRASRCLLPIPHLPLSLPSPPRSPPPHPAPALPRGSPLPLPHPTRGRPFPHPAPYRGKHTRHPRAKAASTKASRSTSLRMDAYTATVAPGFNAAKWRSKRMARLSAAVRPLRSGYPVARNQRFRSHLLLFVDTPSIAVRVAGDLEQGVVR